MSLNTEPFWCERCSTWGIITRANVAYCVNCGGNAQGDPVLELNTTPEPKVELPSRADLDTDLSHLRLSRETIERLANTYGCTVPKRVYEVLQMLEEVMKKRHEK